MREDRDNVGPLPPEEDSGNQPEFVSADIEDYARAKGKEQSAKGNALFSLLFALCPLLFALSP
jgi:hypothetical protein